MKNKYRNMKLTRKKIPWYKVWFMVLTKPSITTFDDIINSSKATSRKAYWWIYITFFISLIIYPGIQIFSFLISDKSLFTTKSIIDGSTVSLPPIYFILICIVIVLILAIGSLFSVFVFMLITMLSHIVANYLGGSGSYEKLVYALASFMSPLIIIYSIFYLFPYGTIPAFLLSLYSLVLNVFAIEATHNLGWKKAIVPVVLMLFFVIGFSYINILSNQLITFFGKHI